MREPWWSQLGDRRLVVSGFGMWGGGLYEVTDGVVSAVDDLSTVGLCLGDGAVWRVLRAPGEFTGTCEVLRYDEAGVDRYWRLDAVRDPHDACWHDGALHVVSSWDGSVWRFAGTQPAVRWAGGSVPDSWHPNCLTAVDGRLYLSAFGRGDRHKEFNGHDAGPHGFVTDLDGDDVVRDLVQPHHPRRVDGGWLVCESGPGRLTHVDDAGRRRHLDIGRYTRGLAVDGSFAYVGGNAWRGEEQTDRAQVAVVDLGRWCVVDRVGLPCLEVYDVLAVPPALAAGLRAGFATNAFRVAEQAERGERPAAQRPTGDEAGLRLATPHQAAGVARTARPVPLDELSGSVAAELPDRVVAGAWTVVRATVRNGSDLAWATVPPHPLGISPRWYALDEPDAEPLVGRSSPLPRPLAPGGRADVEVLVATPERPGRYRLSLTLRQHGVGWFGTRADGSVTVVAPPT